MLTFSLWIRWKSLDAHLPHSSVLYRLFLTPPQSCFLFANLVGKYNLIRLQKSKGKTIDCLQMELI